MYLLRKIGIEQAGTTCKFIHKVKAVQVITASVKYMKQKCMWHNSLGERKIAHVII